MKPLPRIAIVLLNIVFCAALLWFFTRNAFLRPYMGNPGKEIVAGLLLLASVYSNYFLIYPKVYAQHRFAAYWGTVIGISCLSAVVELLLAYTGKSVCNTFTISEPQDVLFMLTQLFFVAGRNITFNVFTFEMRNSRHFKTGYNTEVQVVYEQLNRLDVTDTDSNCILIPINNIYYCLQKSNSIQVHTVDHKMFKRYCSMKHLEQLFNKEDFIRISGKVLIPYKYIQSVWNGEVLLKPLSTQEEALPFIINPKKSAQITEKITRYLQHRQSDTVSNISSILKGKDLNSELTHKETTTLAYIYINPGCKAQAIAEALSCSISTVERVLAKLKQDGLIEYSGSKKTGGYHAAAPSPDAKK